MSSFNKALITSHFIIVACIILELTGMQKINELPIVLLIFFAVVMIVAFYIDMKILYELFCDTDNIRREEKATWYIGVFFLGQFVLFYYWFHIRGGK